MGGGFYGVARGRKPGVFATWDECSQQVSGFTGARFKKFASEEEAKQFVVRRSDGGGGDSGGGGPSTAYVDPVAAAAAPPSKTSEISSKSAAAAKACFSTSPAASTQMRKRPATAAASNSSNPKMSSASLPTAQIVRELHTLRSAIDSTRKSMQSFMQATEKELSSISGQVDGIAALMGSDPEAGPSSGIEPSQKRKRSKQDEDLDPFNDESANGSGKPMGQGEFVVDGEGFVQVFTDGACSMNGNKGAKAGIGVWFNHNHKLNRSSPVFPGSRPTNNVAEIQAATEAVRTFASGCSDSDKRLCINTDSQFLINCVTKWMAGWKRNGWMTAAKEPVKNKEELQQLEDVLLKSGVEIRWNHVRGHSGHEGNEMADELARKGAQKFEV